MVLVVDLAPMVESPRRSARRADRKRLRPLARAKWCYPARWAGWRACQRAIGNGAREFGLSRSVRQICGLDAPSRPLPAGQQHRAESLFAANFASERG